MASLPSMRAVRALEPGSTEPVELLSDAQRRLIERRAIVRILPARSVIYRAGTAAAAIFLVGEGVIKSFRDLPSGRRRIALFLFAHDLFGLAEAGRYVNTTQAITPVRLYELPVPVLQELFKEDAALESQFLCKAVHVLRESQHHTIIVARRDAPGRLAMLLGLLLRQANGDGQKDITIPMTRSDIANYLGLSLEAVVRASRRLEGLGIVQFSGRHQARILDRGRFDALAANI